MSAFSLLRILFILSHWQASLTPEHRTQRVQISWESKGRGLRTWQSPRHRPVVLNLCSTVLWWTMFTWTVPMDCPRLMWLPSVLGLSPFLSFLFKKTYQNASKNHTVIKSPWRPWNCSNFFLNVNYFFFFFPAAPLQSVQFLVGCLLFLAYRQQKFISHSLGSWKSKVKL